MRIRIATRKSELAMWQAQHVAELLGSSQAVEAVELIPLSTRGDEVLDRSLQKIGGKGLFIKELEVAMQAGIADIAVHSMKDVPAEMPDGFCIAALLARADPRDALVSADGGALASIRKGGCIGSSSLRRQAQLRALRPDLQVRALRGNVNTRLDKLRRGDFDAIVLAAAGLARLGKADIISQHFAPADMLPAAAQGVVGVECLEVRTELRQLLEQFDDPQARVTTVAERAVARALDASCHSPVASYATLDGDRVSLQALVAAVDGSAIIREAGQAAFAGADALGTRIAGELLDRGAGKLLRQ